jgi:hypothetical protein
MKKITEEQRSQHSEHVGGSYVQTSQNRGTGEEESQGERIVGEENGNLESQYPSDEFTHYCTGLQDY